MPNPTPELGLQKAVDADDTADYLDTSLANSLTTLDSLFNNVSGHTHGGVHQGGPISAIPAAAIPDGSITSAKIQDGSIQTLDLADGSVTTPKLADNSVTSAKIVDGTIVAADIAAGAVGTAQLADNSVTSAKIVDGSITSADIAAGAVGTSQLASSPTISSPTINNGSVNGAALNNSSANGYQIVGTASTNLAQLPHIESGRLTLNPVGGAGGNFGVVNAQNANFARSYSSPPVVFTNLLSASQGDVNNYAHGGSGTTTSASAIRCSTNIGGTQTVVIEWVAFGV